MNSAFKRPSDQLRVVAMGYIVRCPIGGMAWHHLQYVMGLSAVGHDVIFLEDSGDDPWACYDPQRGVTDHDPSYGLQFARDTFARVGLADRWAYHDALASSWHGPAAERIIDFCGTADLVLNLSGANPLRDWVSKIPVRVYVDTDPVFTQLRHVSDPVSLKRARQHTAFFSFGGNFARTDHLIPDDGLPWQPTRQPVVLDAWPVLPAPDTGAFTTVMQWDQTLQNVPRSFNGLAYGRKSDSFEAYKDLPQLTSATMELALGGGAAPRDELRRKGWRLIDPLAVTRTPWTYQEYIQESKAEFSVAKHGYVVTRSGWFSERSAGYLASGRPVVVEETGFSTWLARTGGVLSFTSSQEAAAALKEVSAHYAFHCREARTLAEEYFDSKKVLSFLLKHAITQDASIPRGLEAQ